VPCTDTPLNKRGAITTKAKSIFFLALDTATHSTFILLLSVTSTSAFFLYHDDSSAADVGDARTHKHKQSHESHFLKEDVVIDCLSHTVEGRKSKSESRLIKKEKGMKKKRHL
jgi:hypothetical protein